MESLVEIGIILLLIVLNGVFAMSEAAILSARKSLLQHQAESGDIKSKAALDLAEHPDRLLSTTQSGITLIGILSGVYGGAGLAHKLAAALQSSGMHKELSQTLSFGIIVLSITYFSLVIGELVPKSLALNNPEKISAAIAKPMGALSALASPVVWILSISTKAVLRLTGIKQTADSPVTEEEIKILMEQGKEAGVFDKHEQDIVERVFRLSDRRAINLMTPRREIDWLDVEDTPEQTLEKISLAPHTALPVCEGSLDHVLGIVLLKTIWHQTAHGLPVDLKAAVKEPIYILESVKALHLLEEFKRAAQHLALVVDEYGVVSGLVTVHDVLEGIVGDVPSSEQPEELPAIEREDGSWLMDGTLSVYDFQRLLNIKAMPEEDEGEYESLGGFVMSRLGRIPVTAEKFEWNDLCFEVLDMDGHRVDKVLVTLPQNKEQA